MIGAYTESRRQSPMTAVCFQGLAEQLDMSIGMVNGGDEQKQRRANCGKQSV